MPELYCGMEKSLRLVTACLRGRVEAFRGLRYHGPMSATIDPELRRAVIEIVDERFRELEVRRSDFIDLKEVVERLASPQVGTEGH